MREIEPGHPAPARLPHISTSPESSRREEISSPAYLLALALLIALSLIRMVSTYHVFNHTIDEGSHVACGVQWLEKGVYQYDLIDTPIPRITVALLPYIAGVRGFGKENYWEEGALELATGGKYWRNLTLARIAVLPFFVLATVVIFLWSRRIYGSPAALVAAGIFTMMPVVLAHSAIATTDIIFTSIFVTCVYAFTRWLAAPSWQTAMAFGIAGGFSAASKYSTLVYLPLTITLTLLVYYCTPNAPKIPDEQAQHRRWGPRTVGGVLRSAAIFVVWAFLIVWSAYRFSHAPVSQFSSAPVKVAGKVFGSSSSVTKRVEYLSDRIQLPAPEYYAGLRFLRDNNRRGRWSYMFGRVKDGGWWYFYIVSLGLKTPLSVLLLAFLGSAFLVANWFRCRSDWQQLTPLLAAMAPLIGTLPSKINIGVRHIMPVFAFLSMLAAWGVVTLWEGGTHRSGTSGKKSGWRLQAGRGLAVVLLAWLAVSSALAHPDYLSYFNELGGSNPANLLIISDLDWGQDLTRLASYLQEQNVKQVSILYVAPFEPTSLGLPETVQLKCAEPAKGWVAIEERYARVYPQCAEWIKSQPIHAYAGKTMRVYYIPE